MTTATEMFTCLICGWPYKSELAADACCADDERPRD